MRNSQPYLPLTLCSSLLILTLFTLACARLERREQQAEAPTAITAVAAGSEGAHPPGDYVEEIVSGGQTRRYRLHVPSSYQPGQALPLIINLHGFNSDAAQQEQVSRMSDKADEVGFIVVYPEGTGSPQSWKFGGGPESEVDVGFIRDLIQKLQGQFTIDSRRIYATGISNGAEMSYRLACDLSDTIAAVGLVSGGYPPFNNCRPNRPIPTVAFHGTADNLLPYEGNPPILQPVHDWAAGWAGQNGCQPPPTITFQKGEVTGETWGNCRDNATVILYTIKDKGHSWPGSNMPARITTRDIDATGVIWEFFTSHPKP